MAESEWEAARVPLTKLSIAETSDLCHSLVEQICYNKNLVPDVYMKSMNLEEWWALTGVLRAFLTTSIKNDRTVEQMRDCLQSVPDEKKTVIAEAASVHRHQLRQHLVDNTTTISQCVLKDFDWQLKLVMSSDKLMSLNEPLLNIDLDLQDGAGESQQVAVELDQNDLKKLLNSLEGCSKAVQQLSV